MALLPLLLLPALFLGLSAAQLGPPQPIYKLRETVYYYRQARFLGVTPPQTQPDPSTYPPGSPLPNFGPETLDADGGETARRGPFLVNDRVTPTPSGPGINSKVTQLRVKSGAVGTKFEGMGSFDQRYSGQGPVFFNSQYTFTPPDVSLCVGKGFVIQTLNLAIRVTDTKGNILAGSLALNQFLGLFPIKYFYPPGTNLMTGDSLSDPSCYFDKDTGRFFLSVFWRPGQLSALLNFGQVRVDNGTGQNYGSGVILAVSGADPTTTWDVFFIPGTNDGYSSHNDSAPPLNYPLPNGPGILQDYPGIATDANGVYITTNQFPYVNGTYYYVGANLYCVSKSALNSGQATIPAVRFALPYNVVANYSSAFTIVPAKTPADGAYDLTNQGTMYFTSQISSNFNSRKGIVLWTLTKTQLLSSNPLGLNLKLKYYNTPTYTYVASAVPQKAGPIPIGKALNSSNVEGLVDTNNGDRVIGCTWSVGKVWASFSTAYNQNGLAGVVVLSLDPRAPALASWEAFGVHGNHLIFPAVNLNSLGYGIVAYALVGPDYFPSAAYTYINGSGAIGGSVEIAAQGVEPLDCFDAYDSPGKQGAMRYGDWQTVVIDESGDAWACVEYTGGKANSPKANWGTAIFRVKSGAQNA